MELGKIFVGGISWDTNEDRLREYFQTFGEVLEAVIMKDRATGRARGFGFVIYADPIVAELVVRQKHVIDGRTVEAKKAVPRDDQHILNRTLGSPTASSPVPIRSKKIFVGGLPSTITEADFKGYFDLFGTITDVVVMYDHNTQRPRGFGFITYDSEEAVERALVRNFHELNGKMVEVKRAVPRELSPGPNRSPLNGIVNTGLTRVNSFINGYSQGFNPNHVASHGINLDETRLTYARSGLLPFSPSNFGSISNYEQRMSPTYNEAPNLFPKPNYEQGFNALQQTNNNVNRNGSFVDQFEIVNSRVSTDAPNPGSSSWSLWGNGSIGDIVSDSLKTREPIWGSSPLSLQPGARGSLSNSGLNLSHNLRENVDMGLYGRDVRTRIPSSSSSSSSSFGAYDNLYSNGREQSWASSFGIGKGVSDVPLRNPPALCW